MTSMRKTLAICLVLSVMLADAKHEDKKQGKGNHGIAVVYMFISSQTSNGSKEKIRKNI